MSGSGLKVQKNHVDKVVRILPVETERNDKEKKVAQMHWQPDKFGKFFPDTLTIEQMKPILVKARVKMENLSINKENDFIVYHYKSRPLLKLNLKDGQFYSLESQIEQFGEESVQHQAHILLDMLKTAGLTKASTGKSMSASSARQTLGQLKSYK